MVAIAMAAATSLLSTHLPRTAVSRRSALTSGQLLPHPLLRSGAAASLSLSLPPNKRGSLSSPFLAAAAIASGESPEASVPIERSFPPFPTAMDISQIRGILPHRFPFLLVDRLIEHKPGETAVGIKNVTINDNFFPGHFPERPIMPGVLMVEAMAQVGGLVMYQPGTEGFSDNFFLAGIDKVRFRKTVNPGDTLVMRVTLVKFQKRFGIAKLEGKAYVGSDLACECEILLAFVTEK